MFGFFAGRRERTDEARLADDILFAPQRREWRTTQEREAALQLDVEWRRERSEYRRPRLSDYGLQEYSR